eukprot:CAMPEP_0119112572 /NCGR_PEP_ID=MMETSP1180-20130426/40838_1 /TAXON_ID=3052 ORGANISM="Chlamydomonas cf sp, Strain CCMP681" /NCGR_SAMPLE_ID=MMETSP1180 /ASSEMBLY_ACC=CAM_ASM_000741 /LENGTH=79 /DNA_ID=CAMNT_0007100147 /DNA_START=409 /DNA_END=645 /DNA_ORIENTATION=-
MRHLGSIVEAGEKGHATFDPVGGVHAGAGQLHIQYKVGGVAGGGKNPSALTGLVEGAAVVGVAAELGHLLGHHPDDGHG